MGCPQQPTAPAEGEARLWLPLPTGSKEKKAFSRSTTPFWKGHRQRTGPEAHHAARSSSCLGRGVPRGSRCGDWPGVRGEGWGRGGGGWILAVPCSEPPAVTSSPGGHCHSDLEPPPRSGQQIGRLPASPRPAQRPHDTVCAEKQSAEQGVACLCCHRSWRSGTLLPHSGWAPGAWRPGEGEHRGGF